MTTRKQTRLDHRHGDCDAASAGFDAQAVARGNEGVTNAGECFVTTKKRNGGPGSDTGIAARCVRLLLGRHGVPRGQESHVVAEALGLQYQQGRRKVAGRTPWTLDQLRVMGERYGESLEQVLEPALRDGWVRATLVIGSWRAQCFALLGPIVEPPFRCELVAIGNANQWVAVPSSGISMPAHEVCRLSLCDVSPHPSPAGAPSPPAPQQ